MSALRTQLSWTNHRIILARARLPEEREFYIRLCAREHYSSRELEAQMDSDLFERCSRTPAMLSKALKEMHPRDRKLLKSKLHEFFGSTLREMQPAYEDSAF